MSERLTRLADLERRLGVSVGPPRAYVRHPGDAAAGIEARWGEGGEPPASGPRPEDVVIFVEYIDPLPREEPRA